MTVASFPMHHCARGSWTSLRLFAPVEQDGDKGVVNRNNRPALAGMGSDAILVASSISTNDHGSPRKCSFTNVADLSPRRAFVFGEVGDCLVDQLLDAPRPLRIAEIVCM